MRLGLSAFCLYLVIGFQAFGLSKKQREHGAEVFVASGCRHCHTVNNVGGHKGPDLSGVGRVLNKEQIRAQILQGGNQMPPFSDDLKPTEVDVLVTYLRSCREKLKKNKPAAGRALDKPVSH